MVWKAKNRRHFTLYPEGGSSNSFTRLSISQLPSPPIIDNQPINLFKLFSAVQFLGGFQTVNQLKAWAQLASIIELVPSHTSIARRTGSINLNDGSNWYSLEQLQQIQQVFSQYLQHFETANSARRHQHQAIEQKHLLQPSHHHLKPPQPQQSQS
ncbi:hypothetical protein O181_042734 [Austropuccinia psidii MF-1]|uniref:ARID domain-containing protein n=1 Tax=Austropuccinia psidii MF-1 TaxID=1389203 RepID=A0A9Q3HHR7_9BASI|nr:hypothetical protein [Austropuccinia psidii MF-1]